jgi:hypothetical protein
MLDTTALRSLTQQDFAMLGFGEVAYLRPITVEGDDVVAIMGADGRQIGMAADSESATMAAFREDLTIVALN